VTAPLGILAAGMVTGVGLSAPASCAAIRCGINNFNESHFVSRTGTRLIGSEVALERPWRGLAKLTKMAVLAVRECLDALQKTSPDVLMPLILCVAEEDRQGRIPGLGGPLLLDMERALSVKFHPESSVVPQGRVGGAIALLRAQRLIHEHRLPHVILVGVDSYLSGPTLAAFEERDRLLTPANSNGFIPGEAASAVLLARPEEGAELICYGPGFARESATIDSGHPLRGDGMVHAVRSALAAASIDLENVDYRISDVSGEQYRFKEVALATIRVLRQRKVGLGLWHPADSIGETGAAVLPTMLAVLYYGARKRYLPGRTFMAHLSNDDDKRAALVVRAQRTT
jgi:3-oxoacyl-[acyl-carrier-protein] synthase-1